MNGNPEEPREEARGFDASDVGHRRSASDGGHVAVVAIVKRDERFAADRAQDVACGVRPLLLGHLRDARQRLAVLPQRTDVAHHENLRVPGHGQRRLDWYPSCAIEGHAKRLGERRRRDARRPQHCLRDDALAGGIRRRLAPSVHAGHQRSRAHFDAQSPQRLSRCSLQRLRERSQHARAALEQDDSRRLRANPAKIFT